MRYPKGFDEEKKWFPVYTCQSCFSAPHDLSTNLKTIENGKLSSIYKKRRKIKMTVSHQSDEIFIVMVDVVEVWINENTEKAHSHTHINTVARKIEHEQHTKINNGIVCH